jgi:metal transporter CNNM
LTYDPKMALPVSAFPLSILPEASPSINCFQALDYLYVPGLDVIFLKDKPIFDGLLFFSICKAKQGGLTSY